MGDARKKEVNIMIWGLSLLWALVFAGMAYIAFSGKGITLSTRFSTYHGISSLFNTPLRHYQGQQATQVGFFMVACALTPFYVLASIFRFYEKLVLILLALGWLVSIAVYAFWP